MKFKIGDDVIINCIHYLTYVKNPVAKVSVIENDNIVYVTNEEIRTKYSQSEGFAVAVKNLRPSTKLGRALL